MKERDIHSTESNLKHGQPKPESQNEWRSGSQNEETENLEESRPSPGTSEVDDSEEEDQGGSSGRQRRAS